MVLKHMVGMSRPGFDLDSDLKHGLLSNDMQHRHTPKCLHIICTQAQMLSCVVRVHCPLSTVMANMDESPTQILTLASVTSEEKVASALKSEVTDIKPQVLSTEEMCEELSSLLKMNLKQVRSMVDLVQTTDLCIWCGQSYYFEFLDGWDKYFLDSCFTERFHCSCRG